MMDIEKGYAIKTYSKSQIAAIYGIASSTLFGWFKRNPKLKSLNGKKKHPKRILTPAEVKLIFEILGEPDMEDDE